MPNYSVVGRKRKLTDSEIVEIIAWHRSKMTNKQMAQKYGISRGVLENIIRTKGRHYKQCSPDIREALRAELGLS